MASKIFSLILLSGFLFSASSANDIAVSGADELLKSLGLDREYHKCLSVADGDTLTLEGLGTVRFVGVDTAEKNHPKLPVQFMSKEAGTFIEKISLGHRIRLEYDSSDQDKRGNYGRVLGYAYLEDGTFLQEALITNGYAVAYTKYPLDEDRKAQFLEWERVAKAKGVGLWKDAGFPEVGWILAQKQPLLQVTKISPDQWRIGFGNWVSDPVPCGKLENHLSRLYSAIYELSPRELHFKLIDMQYTEKPFIGNDPWNIFVIGMAYKRWGVIHKNHALPRVPPEQLDEEIQRLSGWIDSCKEEQLLIALRENQYRRLSETSIDSAEQRRIARGFLTPYEVSTPGQSVIPWDLAENYIGKYMSVEGRIARTHNSGKACFLNFHNNWTRYFSLVIFDNVFHRFQEKPEAYYLDKCVRVSGKIESFKGRSEMVINNPKQIEIIGNP